MKRIRVAVLMGGVSSEREVSLKTGRMICEALDKSKYEVVPMVVGRRPESLPERAYCTGLKNAPPVECVRAQAKDMMPLVTDGKWPDVVFIALHGRYGEDGTVQGMLDLFGIRYTGSGVLASALAMNKAISKKLMLAEGIRTPPFVLVKSAEDAVARASELPLPIVVKPNREGSTIGITIVRSPDQLPDAVQEAFRYDDEVLLERFIEGTEITAALLGNDNPEVLPLVEIVPKSGFYDYESKYTPGATDEIVPARIPEARAMEAREVALKVHKLLGCRGMSRVDMICTEDAVWVLELNTIPGMTETSLLPRAAAAAGISFPELVDRLVQLALEDS